MEPVYYILGYRKLVFLIGIIKYQIVYEVDQINQIRVIIREY